eukprot:15321157-Ditylum_brightwellii.AAC.1
MNRIPPEVHKPVKSKEIVILQSDKENNFCDIKAAHDKKTLEWHMYGLEWAKREANGIKQNFIKSNKWNESSTPAGSAHPAQFNQTSSSGQNEQQQQSECTWL